MSTFALDASSSPSDIISGLNYALANLDTNNPALLGNVLTANTATGEITTTSTNSSGYTSTTIVSYLYQYMNVKYANSATGGSGFTSNATLSNYYGLHNTSSTSISSNPVDYNWFRVTGGFGTTKGLYYQTIGGRQVLFFPNVSAPSTSFVAVQDNTPIDLDTVTAAQNNQIVYISAYYQGNTTPATPAGGFYNFNTLTFTAPFDWSSIIPGFVANTNIYISQNVFSGNSQSNVAPSTTWTTPVIFTSQTSGNTGATGPRGFVPLGFVVVPSDPTTYTTAQLSTAFSSSRSNTNPPIGLGFAPIANDTAQFFYSNSLNVSDTVTLVKQYDGSVWTDVDAQVVSGDLIYPGTITANQISVNSVYALNIQSTDAQLGNIASPGFWLASNTGSARFGGNTNIGNNLTVGANAVIGGNLTVGNNVVIGGNAAIAGLVTAGILNANVVTTTQLVLNAATQTITAFNDTSYATINFVNGSTNNPTGAGYLWPFFTRGFAIGGGATITTTTNGSITGSKITVNYNTYIASATNSQYNCVELWKSGSSNFYSKTFRVVRPFVSSGNIDTFTIPGNNGSLYFGNITTVNSFVTNTTNDLYDAIGLKFNPTPSGDYWWAWGQSGQFVQYLGSLQYSGNIASRLASVGTKGTTYPLFNMYGVSQLSVLSGPNTYLPTVIVGSSGTIAALNGKSTTYSDGLWAFETSGVFADLYDVNADIPNNLTFDTGKTVNYVAVGTGGTILYNTRTFTATGNVATSTGWTQADSNVTYNLNAVQSNYTQQSDFGGSIAIQGNLWVAVGDSGTILRSTSGSGPWITANSVPTTLNLHGIGYTNGNWMAVGDSGTILFSSDASNWTALSNPADGSVTSIGPRNLYGVAGGLINHRFMVAGEEIILGANTADVSSATTWSNLYLGGSSLTSSLTRLQYQGSWSNVANVSLPPAVQQITSGQVVSGTYTDTDYSYNDTITYYLVAGNMFGNVAVTVNGPNLTVTEFKR